MELFERSTRRYAKPVWDIDSTLVGGERAPIHISTVWQRPFCNLLHFERMFCHMPRRPQPKVLIVAPMSGHYATLLRGTVEAFLPNHDVYITDWVDARMVPLSEGRFDLDDYIDYIISILHRLGGDTHVIAVCQPSVPVLAATALMEADKDPYAPRSIVLMGGPIDTRSNPTAVNKLAEERGSRLVPPQRHHQGAVPASGHDARRLSGLPAAERLRQHEPRPARRRASRSVRPSRQGRRRLGAEAPRVLRRVSRGDGSRRGVLPADRRYRVRASRAAEGRDDASRPPGRSGRDPQRGAAHHRGRERRHFRRRADRGGAQAVRQHPAGAQGALSAARRRPLWRVQRLAVPRRGGAADRRFHADARPHAAGAAREAGIARRRASRRLPIC